MVIGGTTGSGYLDTMETLDTDASSWVTSRAKLPRPMWGLRAANIDDRVLIFGKLFITHQILHEHDNQEVEVVVIFMITSWNMSPRKTHYNLLDT